MYLEVETGGGDHNIAPAIETPNNPSSPAIEDDGKRRSKRKKASVVPLAGIQQGQQEETNTTVPALLPRLFEADDITDPLHNMGANDATDGVNTGYEDAPQGDEEIDPGEASMAAIIDQDVQPVVENNMYMEPVQLTDDQCRHQQFPGGVNGEVAKLKLLLLCENANVNLGFYDEVMAIMKLMALDDDFDISRDTELRKNFYPEPGDQV